MLAAFILHIDNLQAKRVAQLLAESEEARESGGQPLAFLLLQSQINPLAIQLLLEALFEDIDWDLPNVDL